MEDRAIPAMAVQRRPPSRLGHGFRAFRAIVGRDIVRFLGQPGRIIAAVAWPVLWLLVFAVGVQSVSGALSIAPYAGAYKPLQEYVIPGLVAVVLLLNGMRTALALVHERDAEQIRLLLTAPLPRWYLLLCKVIAATILSVVEAYLFLLLAFALGSVLDGVDIPWGGWLAALPAIFLCGLMLCAAGLLLATLIGALANRAGTILFVVFPVFLLSSALYPLWRFRENDAEYLYWIATANPFSHAVELIRYAAYGSFNGSALAVVGGAAIVAFAVAAWAYDPERSQKGRRAS